MTYFGRLIAICVVFVCAACGASKRVVTGQLSPTAIQPQAGPSLEGVHVEATKAGWSVSFSADCGPQTLTVELGTGQSAGTCRWQGDTSGALTLAAASGETVEVALVPLPGNSTPELRLLIEKSSEPKQSAAALNGGVQVMDLMARADGSGNNVTLEWMQYVQGDYNFDGYVTAADLQPLAAVWLQTVDRNAPGVQQLTTYWLDGNADGRIDFRDLDMLRKNIGLSVGGYRIERNSTLVPGIAGGQIAVVQPAACKRPGLPSTFGFTCPGKITDSWQVKPVGCNGHVFNGCWTGGGDCRIHVEIIGDLQPIDTDDEPRFSTRVIYPIELIDNIQAPTAVASTEDGPVTTVPNAPRGSVLLAQVEYQPSGGSTNVGHGASSISLPDMGRMKTCIPFTLPQEAWSLDVYVRLSLETRADGHKLVRIDSSLSCDNGTPEHSLAVLDLNTGLLRRDTNSNNSLEDELDFADRNRDGISDELWSEIISLKQPRSVATKLQVVGQILSVTGSGWIQLTQVQSADGSGRPPSLMELRVAENTRLGTEPSAAGLLDSDYIAATVHQVQLASGRREYWASSLQLLGSTPPAGLQKITATRLWDGSTLLRWNADPAYGGQRIVRRSKVDLSSGPGNSLSFALPNGKYDWTLSQKNSTSYSDRTTNWYGTYRYDVFGLDAAGKYRYIGTSN